MNEFMRRVGKFVIAGVLGLAVPSAALAQQPTVQNLGPIPPAMPVNVQPAPLAPTPPAMPASPVPVLPAQATLPNPPLATQPQVGNPALQPGVLPNAYPIQPGGAGSFGISDGLPTRIQTPTQPQPLLSSQPPPFQVTPDTPAASQDPNFYPGNRPIQDLSALLAGNFKDTKYKWYGFVRLDGIYDFRPMASTDSFVTSAIPVPQGRGQNAVLTPRYTRFGFDTETPIKSLDWDLKTRIEVDFFNGNTSGAFGSFPLRLRFAWADFGPFIVGQAASLFMDYDVFPNVLDYQGPGGMILMRQPLFGIHLPIGQRLKFSLGIEQPYSDIQWFENGTWHLNPGSGIITTPGIGRNVQDVPDLTGNVRYAGDNGHLQVAGIVRKLTFQPGPGNSALDTVGYGINLTGTYHPWAALCGVPSSGDCATPMSKSRFLGQFAAGRGISRYYNDVNGLGLDATYDPTNGFRALPSFGWFMAYEQWWAKTWASTFTYGEDALGLTSTLPGNTYQRANYVSANIIWLPVQRLGVGLEYLYGFRKDKDGQKGDNSRIQMAFQYRF